MSQIPQLLVVLDTLNPFEALRFDTLNLPIPTFGLEGDFYLKDIYTTGLQIVAKRPITDEAQSSMDILAGYTLLDDAEDPVTNKPILDYYLWTALARLMITAGDLATAAVEVSYLEGEKGAWEEGAWNFAYTFPLKAPESPHIHGTSIKSFMSLVPVKYDSVMFDRLLAQEGMMAGYKAMGPIDKSAYIAQLGAYPLAVHPKLVGRSIAVQLHYLLVDALTQNGLQILGHYQPEDTSKHPAFYYLSDGASHYLLRYNAPVLRDSLIRIDAAVGRTEEDGAIVADPTVQSFLPMDAIEELEASHLAKVAASVGFPDPEDPLDTERDIPEADADGLEPDADVENELPE